MDEGGEDDDNIVSLFLSPINEAGVEHQALEDLAALFCQWSHIFAPQHTSDHDDDTEVLKEFFSSGYLAIEHDDFPIWQVPVKVCLCPVFLICFTDPDH